MTITEFILARVAEKEEGAKVAYPSPWRAGGNPGGHVWTGADSDPEDGPTVYVNGGIYANQRRTAEHIARTADPDRVLAECEAIREAIRAAWADHVQIEGEWGMGQSRGAMDAKGDVPGVVTALAAIWVDHPDYREEWR